MTGLYRLAERNIEITSAFADVHKRCQAYKTTGTADFSVVITAQDIDFEREQFAREDLREGNPIRQLSDAQLESSAVHRKIVERMPCYDTVLFHGSCIAVDGEGFLFTAPSGTGKSTHTRLWRELLGDRAVMVNDDKPLIRVEPTGATVFGTPWNGKHRLGSNIAVPLKAMCVLTRGKENTIKQISLRESFSEQLQHVYRPLDNGMYARTIELLARLITSVTNYKLSCNTDSEAARIAYHAMKEASAPQA